MIKGIILALVISVPIAATDKPGKDGVSDKIKVGIVKEVGERQYVVIKETNKIPLTLKKDNPEFQFGFSIPRNTIFGNECVVIWDIPKPKSFDYSDNFGQTYHKSLETTERLEAKAGRFACKEGGSVGIRFDDGDQVGLYQINILSDGLLVKTIKFDVVPK